MNTPTLATERLILRKFTEDDLDALYKIFGDKEVNRFLPWFALQTPQDAKGFFANHYAGYYNLERAYRYAICLKQDNVPIGYVNVDIGDSHDLGYGLRKEFWHKGIVTEACKVVVEQLKKDGAPFITATHDVDNPRSSGVMRQLKMKYCYSYVEQWQPKNMTVTFRMYQLNLDGNDRGAYRKYWNDAAVRFIETEIE